MESRRSSRPKFTGERVINHPDSLLGKISLERYKFAANYAKNKDVLDISCGSGYGSNYLAETARSVLGADVDPDIADYCKKEFKKDNLSFQFIDKDIEIERFSSKFDLVVSFETIEHTQNGERFLAQLKKYAKDDGVIILSTPNNFKKIHPPENKFHIREFDAEELVQLAKKIFPDRSISLFGQCQTTMRRSDPAKKEPFFKRLLKLAVQKIYNFDLEHVGLLRHFEHLRVYQALSRLQQSFEGNISVYPINKDSDFLNPLITILAIENKK